MNTTTIVPALLSTLLLFGNVAVAEPRAGAAAAPAIKRFAQVDARLYRGGQPDEQGFRALRDLGVRTVINLRERDDERKLVEGLGMSYVHIPVEMHAFGRSGDVPAEAVARFFQVVDDPSNGPVFVHCRRGADRTGTFVAMYRITRQQWAPGKAYDEAREIGMRWWHYPVKRQLDALALPPPSQPTAGLATAPAPR